MRKIFMISLLPLWLWGNDVFKENFYKSLGVSIGWYNYSEQDENGGFIMSINTARLSFVGNLGYATRGVKLEGILEASYGLGIYTGSILDTDNSDRNGEAVQNLDGVFTGNIDLKAGYDLLKPFHQDNAKLYFQSGIGYFLNRNEFMSANRLQGYLYVPLELEGEVRLPAQKSMALNFLLGYRYFILGNHFTAASNYGFTDDYHTIQKNGFGINALLGATYLKDSNRRGVYLVYEYWNIGAANPMRTQSIVTGDSVAIYEPKNSSHIVRLQFSFGF
ncbi:hypothetical protein LS68_001470 [Helicobacter sp. MIT 05-5293]|uniref:hypothetical protein n=1 Tax=Helicobacter sp. MIT 05-5293 TaxID=1548149 RepID=UPI000689CA64|nr:hypothetical protein [Helicobacter sp. MIT 05-5293]TLD81725.1 hypothetical protein LS68_001470 [Helicobacter sp. MIT 05-5293]